MRVETQQIYEMSNNGENNQRCESTVKLEEACKSKTYTIK